MKIKDLDCVRVEVISLFARLNTAKNFILNTDMKIECDLLRAQIIKLQSYLPNDEHLL